MQKRIFDIVFSFVVLSLFLWLLIISWFIAAIDTRTNGIFTQQRIGQHGRKFTILKLRTIKNDLLSGKQTISKMGFFLRKYKLDELPQLLNILSGKMSVVGPRPDLEGYYDLLEGESKKIVQLKPGLTSAASLKYINEEEILKKQNDPLLYNMTVIFPDKVQMNLAYFYNHSVFGDFKIILKTVIKVWF
ncbi:Sugar transferase involved in LPS biosynthesis (colanic, teichoic acid) [Flavobacterium segetis]|uniref:Sugar transferase involved in LPS biosynthesis (Colanic, teichoic acid) n=1 Tax=Flavobacterium segetis TaxID=271157 RepID=A0A1M5J8E0_9FLAO|nr:sugar transferase [Flavobacterium segetis]SHG36761.1 Sugar transferase involved in LPS biosynthesis (colanic, teichoic acid) [Flavobacterium segetis]